MLGVYIVEQLIKNEKNMHDQIIFFRDRTESRINLILLTNIFLVWSIMKLDKLRASQIEELKNEIEELKKGD